ncbi:MAG: Brp/Blh family beta-carotene 15,15'-dioxygenase [Bacteroidota bacterium]
MIRVLVVSLAVIVLLLSILGVRLEDVQGYLFIITLVTVGIPHGSLDHKILFSNKLPTLNEKLKFYITYVSLMLVTGVCWYLEPKWSFIGFLVLSAYHFGQSQLYYVNLGKGFSWLMYLSWGVFLLSSIIYFNLTECLNFFLSLDQLEAASYVNSRIMVLLMIGSGGLLLALLVAAFFLSKISIRDLGYEVLSLIVIIALAVKSTAVITFIVYFGLWHSLVSLTLEYQHLKHGLARIKLSSFINSLFPHSAVAILFMVSLYWYSLTSNWGISPYMMFIVLISIITVPHLFVMSRLYNLFGQRFV